MGTEKIKSRKELARLLPELKAKGKTIGLTNGVFDLLHTGHIRYLSKAKSLCNVLVVSLNTDASVRAYKGPTRPIVPLRDRQLVVAALEVVDYVTSHSERRMKRTLELLQPHLYIKGGDYGIESLTSRHVVEACGGSAVVLPLVRGRSTSHLLRRCAEAALREGLHLPDPSRGPAPAAFLDRDGVILRHVPHLADPAKVQLATGAVEGLRHLGAAGFRLVVVTNQPGIGMGYLTREDFFRVNAAMLSELHRHGVLLEAVYFCPHSLAVGCTCRKPHTGLLKRAVKELPIHREGSCLFGDREQDMETARRFKIPGILVGPGDTPRARRLAVLQADTLAEAVQAYLKTHK